MSDNRRVSGLEAETARDVEASPAPLAWIAAMLVVLAAIAFALIRVQPVNLPWHLATAG